MGRPKKLQPSQPAKRRIKEESPAKDKKQRGRQPKQIELDKDDVIEIDVFEKPTKKTKTKQVKANDDFYPEVPSHHFPESLEENILKAVASLDNSAKLNDLVQNLQRFYVEKIQANDYHFQDQMRYLEEEGILNEKDGVYSVHRKHLPVPIHDLVHGNIRIEVEPHEIHLRDSPKIRSPCLFHNSSPNHMQEEELNENDIM